MSTTRRAWERWQAAAGPWKGWSVCPALLAPGIEYVTPASDFAERPTGIGLEAVGHEIAGELRSSLEQGGVLAVLDLEPILGVHIAALLNAWHVANSVLLVPRWPYAEATLPVDGLVHALVSQARRLAADDAHLPNVAFVLDNQRQRPLPRRPAHDRRADNRYRLAVADLPDLKALRARGIQRILRIQAA